MRTRRAPIDALAKGDHVLSSESSHYLIRVLRLDVGDTFIAFDPKARKEADATIVDASPTGARVAIGAVRDATNVATTPLVLVYALAKGDKVDAVVRDATELGATSIILARTERSIAKSPADRADKKNDRWKRVVEQAARQCGRADPPTIDGVHAWADALDRASGCDARFCLDPRAVEPLGNVLAPAIENGSSIAFAIGPEGGLTSDEIEIALGKGWIPTSLGGFILRTETVTAAVLGAVRVLLA
jgi:16S rRNA (uracil1498-N3)-methyltransferase